MSLPEGAGNPLGDVLGVPGLGRIEDQDVIRVMLRHCRVLGRVGRGGKDFGRDGGRWNMRRSDKRVESSESESRDAISEKVRNIPSAIIAHIMRLSKQCAQCKHWNRGDLRCSLAT